jgi:salicylate hydroxylase
MATGHRTTKAPLDIIIVGAGLGGLSAAISCALAGHNVLVLEGAKQLAEVSYLSLGSGFNGTDIA